MVCLIDSNIWSVANRPLIVKLPPAIRRRTEMLMKYGKDVGLVWQDVGFLHVHMLHRASHVSHICPDVMYTL